MNTNNTTSKHKVLVIQSHRQPLPYGWLQSCLDSVQRWAIHNNFDYRFIGDEIFELLDPLIRLKTANQIVVASDIARLLAIDKALKKGYDCVVWCDADFLIFTPRQLLLSSELYGFGRETWVQTNQSLKPGIVKSKIKAYKKIHNAFMFFRQENPFLAFYIHSIQQMLHQHTGHFSPQFAGPKFLSAIHNITHQPVVENAGMLSPLVIKDIIAGGGQALTLFQQKSSIALAGANLCSSLIENDHANDNISNQELKQVIKILQSQQEIFTN
ncbi:MAG: hypothetical protein KUG75_04865 [Pseudomonadales bacterium]|nr:hypothetical protein [Pseudomonadales bacterium]